MSPVVDARDRGVPQLKLPALVVLRHVAEQGSLAGAAEALSCSSSAVSQQIAALERDVGMSLFVRGTRPIRLTEAGRLLVRHADGIVRRLREAEAAVRTLADSGTERLRLASFATAGTTLLPQAVGQFAARHANVELTITEADREESVAMLRRDEIDLAVVFRYEDALPEDDDVAEHPLLDDPLVLALPPRHRLSASGVVALEDVADETWIQGRQATCRAMLDACCAAAGFRPRVEFETDDYPTVLALVGAGAGVALVPQLAIADLTTDVAICSLGAEGPIRRVSTIQRADRVSSPALDAMLRAIRAQSARIDARPPLTAVAAR